MSETSEVSDISELSNNSDSKNNNNSDNDVQFSENHKQVNFKIDNKNDSDLWSDSSTITQEKISVIDRIEKKFETLSLSKKEFQFDIVPKVKQNVLNQVIAYTKYIEKKHSFHQFDIISALHDYFDHCYDYMAGTFKQFKNDLPRQLCQPKTQREDFVSLIFDRIIVSNEIRNIKHFYSISFTDKTDRDHYTSNDKMVHTIEKQTKILAILINKYSTFQYSSPKRCINSFLQLKYHDEELYLEGLLGLFTYFNACNVTEEIKKLFNDSDFNRSLEIIQDDWRSPFMNDEFVNLLHTMFLHVLIELFLYPLFQGTLRSQIYRILSMFDINLLIKDDHFLEKVFVDNKSDIVNGFHSLIVIFTKHMYVLEILLPMFRENLHELDESTQKSISLLKD